MKGDNFPKDRFTAAKDIEFLMGQRNKQEIDMELKEENMKREIQRDNGAQNRKKPRSSYPETKTQVPKPKTQYLYIPIALEPNSIKNIIHHLEIRQLNAPTSIFISCNCYRNP